MKKILIFAMILLIAGCADWDGAGRRDRGRHDGGDRHERDSQRQEQGHGGL